MPRISANGVDLHYQRGGVGAPAERLPPRLVLDPPPRERRAPASASAAASLLSSIDRPDERGGSPNVHELLARILTFAEAHPTARAVILTGSRAPDVAPADALSDLDVYEFDTAARRLYARLGYATYRRQVRKVLGG
jgi:hypothetical protein